QLGYANDVDVVHAHAGMGTMPMVDSRSERARDLAFLLAKSVAFPASNKMLPSEFNRDVGSIVIAGVEAICKPGYNLYAVGATTGSAFQHLIVNGPSRDRAGIDYSYGCMGGSTGRGSRTIGRAVALCLRNIGGQKAGTTTKSCFGQPARHGLCFGEWEEMSPWPSLAEQLGYANDVDVVHAHAGMGTMPMVDSRSERARDLAFLLAKSVAFPASNKMLPSEFNRDVGSIVIAINPDWAARLGREFGDVRDLQSFFLEHAWQPLELWPLAERPLWECRADAQGRVHMNARPEQFTIVVCGGQVALHGVCLPSWGESEMQSQLVVTDGRAG
ncbi:MAG TPA: hypothetical protein VLL25_14970, partial [Acidimicrobiales bacterium]|nr:hypothetical protein [Acidimicrobiales bacterium]